MIWPPLLVQMALTASGMARFLSVSLLVLSVAPWGAIYTLVLSQYAQSYQEVQEEEATTLLAMLQNNNVTMEDLLTRVFRDRMTYDRDAFMLPNTLHHWTIVLPWSISLVMGIIIPFVLSLFSCLHPRDEFRLDPDEDPWISRHRKERRLKRLVVACEEYRKILVEDDKEECKSNTTDEDDEDEAPKWKLPLPGIQLCKATTTRTIEGTCAICLAHYKAGDEVIWSSNPKCKHAYHDDCILSWLLRRRKQCPCCRQSFLLKPE